MIKLFSILLFSLTLQATMLIGVGEFDISKKAGHYSFKDSNITGASHAYITEALRHQAPNVKSVVIWITRNWQEDWFSADEVQKEVIDKGYTPVFIFYYFGDEISENYIKRHKKAYYKQLRHFSRYLQKLHGKKIVVLNPEYNMAGCEKLASMNDLFLKSFAIVREASNVLVGPCVGDFGNYAKVNEPQEWKLFDPSLKRAAKSADFIAFQEMRALTRNSKDDILNTPQRAYNLAKYLHKKYKKPTMLAYLAISSYGKGGEQIQADVYKGFVHYLPKMQKEAALIFFGVFHYFDYSGHVGYFNKAEEYFGVLKKDGMKKPSFVYFRELH
jgi:hypothetical protein